jgi:hypothetical protein
MFDIALVQDAWGRMTVHTADCPDARRAAAEGLAVMTLIGCARMPTKDEVKQWHSCLADKS